jgi:signal transduction histidine kinase
LQFVEASAVNLRKKREAASKLAELMSKVAV